MRLWIQLMRRKQWVDAATIHQRYKEGERTHLLRLKMLVNNYLCHRKKAWTQADIEVLHMPIPIG